MLRIFTMVMEQCKNVANVHQSGIIRILIWIVDLNCNFCSVLIKFKETPLWAWATTTKLKTRHFVILRPKKMTCTQSHVFMSCLQMKWRKFQANYITVICIKCSVLRMCVGFGWEDRGATLHNKNYQLFRTSSLNTTLISSPAVLKQPVSVIS